MSLSLNAVGGGAHKVIALAEVVKILLSAAYRSPIEGFRALGESHAYFPMLDEVLACESVLGDLVNVTYGPAEPALDARYGCSRFFPRPRVECGILV